MYLFTQFLHHGSDCDTKSILSEIQLVWIQIFTSTRMAALPILRSDREKQITFCKKVRFELQLTYRACNNKKTVY